MQRLALYDACKGINVSNVDVVFSVKKKYDVKSEKQKRKALTPTYDRKIFEFS